MKRIALPLSLLILLCWAVLQPADILNFSAPFMQMRNALTPLLGALALGWMGFCMLLALRPAWLQQSLGGLGKLYHTHKWAGITAVLLVVAHWLLILSARTVGRGGHGGHGGYGGHGGHGGHGGGGSLFGLAREMGEWSAWIMIVLGLVAVMRLVPNDWFRNLHKGFPVAFLMGAFHSVMLLRDGTAGTPFGILTIAIALAGSVIAVISLAGLIGDGRRHAGRVEGAGVEL